MVAKSVHILLFLLTWSLAQAQVEFSASVDRKTLGMGQRFKLTFSLNSKGSGFTPPNLADFHVISGPNQSTSMQWINGNFSSSLSYSYVLQPKGSGTFTIGPATIEVDGEEYKSNPVQVTIEQSSASQSPSTSQSQARQQNTNSSLQDQLDANLFMKLYVDKTTAYIGEQVIATYKIYNALNIVDNQVDELPTFNGFYSQDIEIPNGSQITTEVINGKRFTVATIKKVVLFPQQDGSVTIPSLSMNFVVRVQDNQRRRSIWDPFFGGYKDIRHHVRSNSQTIKVKPLPANRPSGFNGAVGSFEVDVSVDRKQVAVDDALTYTLRISGKGNLKLLQDPSVQFPVDFEAYDPELKEQISVSAGGVSGSKAFEYLLIPRHAGTFTIPAYTLTYFDPASEKYRTLHTEAIELEVAKGSGREQASHSAPNKEDVQLIGKDIRFIKTGAPQWRDINDKPFLKTPWFYVLCLLPFMALAVAVAFYRQFSRQQADVVGFRRRQANKEAKRRLAKARKLLAEGAGKEFYEELYRASYGYLSDKLNIPLSEMERQTIREKLEARQLPEPIVKDTLAFLDECDMARYAPALSKAKGPLLEENERMINNLEHAL